LTRVAPAASLPIVREPLRSLWVPVLAALAACAARAQTLVDDLTNYANDTGAYNLVTFGDAALSDGNTTQGGLVVAGDFTDSGNAASAKIANSAWSGAGPSLYVGGALDVTGKVLLENGDASTANAENGSNWTWYVKGSTYELKGVSDASNLLQLKGSTTDPLSNSWTPTTGSSADFTAIATDLAGADATGTISVSSGTLTFSAPDGQTDGVVVFDLDASLLNADGNSYDGAAFTAVKVKVPTGINYVINLVGLTSDQTLFSGVDFESGTNDNQLLWNFEATTATITLANTGTFLGSVLAPQATIDDEAATVNGQVVTEDFDEIYGTTGQKLDFTAFTALVPESPGFAWWALGLCAAGIAIFRRPFRRRA
jgi:choice-of-anchor A domain-containing protein